MNIDIYCFKENPSYVWKKGIIQKCIDMVKLASRMLAGTARSYTKKNI